MSATYCDCAICKRAKETRQVEWWPRVPVGTREMVIEAALVEAERKLAALNHEAPPSSPTKPLPL